MSTKQINQGVDFPQQREHFFQQHPAPQRQAAWERVQAAFAQVTEDVDLDQEREERINQLK